MKMTEVETAELVGDALDWAVAICLNGSSEFFAAFGARMLGRSITEEVTAGNIRPSTDWAQGGRLFDTYMIDVTQCPGSAKTHKARAVMDSSFLDIMGLRQRVSASGPTALIAACRAIVAAKLGDVVSVPSQLLEPMQ